MTAAYNMNMSAPQSYSGAAAAATMQYPQPQSSTYLSSGNPLANLGKSLYDFCANTLKYIGENPIKFAVSVGMSMAIKFGVTAGMISLGIGLGPLGLAVAGAMLTSVIMGVGSKILKGESLNAKDLTGKALFSGAIAGVLGAFLGGQLDGVAEDIKARQNIDISDYHEGPFDPNTHNPSDQYSWQIEDWPKMKEYLDANHLSYEMIDPDDVVTIEELKNANNDWTLFIDPETGQPYNGLHRDGLNKMIAYVNQEAIEAGVPKADLSRFSIKNSEYLNAYVWPKEVGDIEVNTRTGTAEVTNYDIQFNVGAIVGQKDVFEFVAGHEVGHLEDMEDWYDFAYNDSSHQNEHDADILGMENGNFDGALETHVRIAVHRADYLDPYEDPLDKPSSSHPTPRERIEGVLRAASEHADAQAIAELELRIEKCQTMLDNAGLDMDLERTWQNAQSGRLLTDDSHAAHTPHDHSQDGHSHHEEYAHSFTDLHSPAEGKSATHWRDFVSSSRAGEIIR